MIGYDEGEGIERRHGSFTGFLNACAVDSRDALEEARQGEDLCDLDFWRDSYALASRRPTSA